MVDLEKGKAKDKQHLGSHCLHQFRYKPDILVRQNIREIQASRKSTGIQEDCEMEDDKGISSLDSIFIKRCHKDMSQAFTLIFV